MTISGAPRTQLTTREADRIAIAERLSDMRTTVVGGLWDGRDVVPYEKVIEALAPMEPATEYAVEVRVDKETHGRVVAWVACPTCGIAQACVLRIKPRLTTESDEAAIKAVVTTKAKTHVCNQEVVALSDVDGAIRMWRQAEIEQDDDSPDPSGDINPGDS